MAAKSARLKTPPKRQTVSRVPKIYDEPRTLADKIFCERYVVHNDHNLAYTEAGHPRDPSSSIRKLEAMRPYIDKLREKVDRKLLQELTYEKRDILDHMAAIGMANVLDYVEWYEIYETDPETKQKVVRKAAALKPLNKLTRLQASAIEEFTYHPERGVFTYSLPSIATKAQMLKVLGENTGAIKREDDGVKHLHLHLKQVDMPVLEQLRELAIKALGSQNARAILGTTEEDIEG